MAEDPAFRWQMPSKDYLDRLDTHGRNLTDAIKVAKESGTELGQKLDEECGAFLQAMSDFLEDMRRPLEH